ncbi:hypothetical protein [Mangrovibrevibacter kandeliae]|nr:MULTISPECIES: hypothetical protein [unclassified Aurantimonas]MCQ8780771.1 hypothetical protein [Aurantimonas sp. CSK15Z-1]MCW4113554.1 hypothetical protein [Aurantimonas sp. MSK8Z-1]
MQSSQTVLTLSPEHRAILTKAVLADKKLAIVTRGGASAARPNAR